MKKTAPAGFTAAQLAAARKSGGTIKLGGPTPPAKPAAKPVTKPAPVASAKPAAKPAALPAPAKVKRAPLVGKKVAPKSQVEQISIWLVTAENLIGQGTEVSKTVAKVRIADAQSELKRIANEYPDTDLSSLKTEVERLAALASKSQDKGDKDKKEPPMVRFANWIARLFGRSTPTPTPATTQTTATGASNVAPVRGRNWFGWLFLILAIITLLMGLAWKNDWLFFSKRPKVQIVRDGPPMPQVEVPGTLIPLPASTNQEPELTGTPSSGFLATNTALAPHSQQWPSKVTGIEGDNNDGNSVNVFVNNGSFTYTSTLARSMDNGNSTVTVHTNLSEVDVSFKLPPGCTSVVEVSVPTSLWNAQRVAPISVDLKPKQFLRIISPPSWLVDHPFEADGFVEITHDGIPWIPGSGRATAKEWGYYMAPGTTRCHVTVHFRHP